MNPTAVSRFTAASRAKIERYAAKRVGIIEAEDIASETLMRLLRCARDLEGNEALAYAYRTAANIMNDRNRRHAQMQTVSFDSKETHEFFSSMGVEDAHPSEEGFEDLIAGVPGKQRTVLRLRYVERLTYGEIEQDYGISENAAKSMAFRGHAAIRQALEPHV